MGLERVKYLDWETGIEEDEFSRISHIVKSAARRYVHTVDRMNQIVGGFSMYLLVVMLAILTYSIITNAFNSPSIWVMEGAQFTMAAYYLLGGGYSMQQGAHVRMDFLYERWTPKKRAWVDAFTIFFVMFYLGVLVSGGIDSSSYAIEYGQRNRTVWAPYMAPIKIVMTIGMLLMLLQAVSEFIKDLARIAGREIR